MTAFGSGAGATGAGTAGAAAPGAGAAGAAGTAASSAEEQASINATAMINTTGINLKPFTLHLR